MTRPSRTVRIPYRFRTNRKGSGFELRYPDRAKGIETARPNPFAPPPTDQECDSPAGRRSTSLWYNETQRSSRVANSNRRLSHNLRDRRWGTDDLGCGGRSPWRCLQTIRFQPMHPVRPFAQSSLPHKPHRSPITDLSSEALARRRITIAQDASRAHPLLMNTNPTERAPPRSPDELLLSDAQKAELDRRLDAYHRNPDQGSPWPEVKERIRSRR